MIGVSIGVVDISMRKLVEEALKESEDHYRHSVELNPQIPWTMNTEGKNIEISPRWEELTGLTLEQSKGHGWMEALHPDDARRVVDRIEEMLKTAIRSTWNTGYPKEMANGAGCERAVRHGGIARAGLSAGTAAWRTSMTARRPSRR